MANPTGLRTISFNVSEQYDIQDIVGEGAYGVVWYVYAFISSCILADEYAIWPKCRHQEDYAF
jgi:hypothetical protein